MEQLYTQSKLSCLNEKNFTQQGGKLCRLSSTFKGSTRVLLIILVTIGLSVRTYAQADHGGNGKDDKKSKTNQHDDNDKKDKGKSGQDKDHDDGNKKDLGDHDGKHDGDDNHHTGCKTPPGNNQNPCTGFFTVTQGGWGAPPHGGNPAMYLHTNFSSAFPSGLTVGCSTGFNLMFSTADDIQAFLPSGSTPRALTQSFTNPGGSYSNVFAGQVVTLALNVGFDLFDENFAPNTTNLGDLTIASGAFQGWTVTQLLDTAEKALGGCTTSINISSLNDAVDAVNSNFDEGASGSFLNCGTVQPPSCSITVDSTCSTRHLCAPDNLTHYAWSTGATTQCITVTSATASTYSVTITNSDGISSTCSQHVSGVNMQVPCTITPTGTLDNGGTVTLTGPSGSGLSFTWTPGGQHTSAINVTVSGTYSLTVSNNSGCSSTCTYPVPPAGGSNNCTISVTCGSAMCHAMLCGPNNAGPYLWNPGGATSQCIDVTTAGVFTYTLTVNAGTANSVSCATTFTVNPTPTCDITPTGTLDNGGTVTLTGPSGNGLSYVWSPGLQHSSSINVVVSGTYTLTVSNASGCSSTCTYVVPPAGGSNNCDITVSCGSAMCHAMLCGPDNAGPYLWSPGGATTQCIDVTTGGTFTYTLTINAGTANSLTCSRTFTVNPTPSCNINMTGSLCNGNGVILSGPSDAGLSYAWSNGASTSSISVSTGGTYSLTVTNSFGCSSTCSQLVTGNNVNCNIDVTSGTCSDALCGPAGASSYLWSTGETTSCITVTTPGTFTISLTVNAGTSCATTCSTTCTVTGPPSCNIQSTGNLCNGNATLTGPSGSGLTYAWSTGATTSSITVTTAGTYTLTVRANGGCSSTCTSTVTGGTGVACDIFASCGNNMCFENLCGPAGASSYLWSTGETTSCILVTASGTYTLTLNGGSPCSSTCVKSVTINPTPVCNISQSGNLCVGGVTLSETSTADFYSWSTGATTSSIVVTAAGTYTLTVSNTFGCSSTCTATVTGTPVSCSVSGNTKLCSGQSTQLCANATGATGYAWSNGESSSCITVSTEGTYSVIVSNNGGCTSTCSASVTVGETPSCTIDGLPNVCAGDSTRLCAPSNLSSYSWSNGATTQCIYAKTSGTYTVTVSNGGCSSTCTQTVNVNQHPSCTINQSGNPCTGGPFQLCGPSGVTYSWSSGETTSCITVTAGGTYSLTTSSNSCSSTCTQLVTIPTPLSVNCFVKNQASMPQVCDAKAYVTMTGGTAPFTFAWSNGETTDTATALCASTSYTVTVTDANKCTNSCVVTIPGTFVGCTLHIHAVTPGAVCVGGSVALNLDTVTGQQGPLDSVTYIWKGPNGFTSISRDTTLLSVTLAQQGTYSIVATDSAGCKDSTTVPVIINALPTVNAGPDVILTCGVPTAILTATTTPSTGLTFSWSPNGETTSSITVTSSDIYIVTVTNPATGCTNADTVNVGEDMTPPTVTVTNSLQLTCVNTSVILTADVSSGATLMWSVGNQTTSTITVTAAGTFTVTATNTANGCSASDTVVVNSNTTPPTINAGPDQVITCGVKSVTITPTVSAGATLSWSPGGQTTSSITVTSEGTFIVTATNTANGCKASDTVIVTTNLAPPTVTIPTPAQLTCANTSVTLTANASAGATLVWSVNSQTTSTITVTAAGTFTVTATNPANGCTATATVTVTGNTTPPTVTIPTPAQLTCANTSVTLTANASAGATLVWSVNSQTTSTITVTAAGTFTVTATNPANGCTATATVTVTGNTTPPTVTIPTPAQLTCANTSVTLTANASAGATLVWSVNSQTTSTITVTAAGTFTVTATNPANGCTATATVTVTGNTTPPTVTIPTPAQLTCANTSVTLTANASAGATLVWSVNSQTTSTITVTAAGTFTVTATNPANGCTATATVTVTGNTTPPTVTIPTPAQLTCANTSVTLTANASAGATLVWSVNSQTTSTITVTAAGTFTVTATNPANGCTATATVTVTGNTTPPTVTIPTPAQLTCANTSVTLTANASAGATLVWSVNSQTTSTITVTAAGTFTVTATNPANGCTATATVTVTGNTTPPTVTIPTPAQLTCANTSVTLTANASAGATLVWSVNSQTTSTITVTAAGTFTVTATNPANGCTATATVTVTGNTTPPTVTIPTPAQLTCANTSVTLTANASAGATLVWSVNSQTTSTITVTAAGTFTVTATNPANGCTATATVTVTGNTTPPTVTIPTPAQLTCANTSVTLTANASAGATLVWSVNSQTTSTITVTAAGTFTVTATNPANGCTATATVTVTGNTTPPTVTIPTPAQLTCANTSVTLTANASAGATLVWSVNSQTTSTITVTAAGTFTVTATNPANGCTATATVTVTGNTTPPTVTIPTPAQLTCANTSVTLTANASAGATLVWSVNSQTTSTITVTAAGTFTVTATNPANGCTATATVTVTGNTTPPTVTIPTPAQLTCANTSVTLTANASAGATLVWSVNSQTTSTITVTAAGTFTVTATNPANGCTATATVTVTGNTTKPTVNAGKDTVLTCSPATITLTATASPNVTFAWSPGGATTSAISVSSAGTYIVTVTSTLSGCTASDTVVVTANNTPPTCMIGCSCGPILCEGKTATICTATGYASYHWSTGETTACIVISTGGDYSVTVSKSNGCTTTCSQLVNVSPNPSCTISGVDSVCQGGGATFCAPSGNDYLWSNGAALECVTLYQTGTVSVTVTNPSGCSTTCTKSLVVTPAPACSITGNLVICDGQTTVLTADSVAGDSFFWSSGATTRSITVSVLGTYSVTITNADGCGNECSVCVTLGACRKMFAGIEAGVYPNPFEDKATIEFKRTDKSARTVIEVFNTSGVRVATLFNDMAELGVVYQTQFSGENIPVGIYMYRIMTEGGDKVVNGRLSLVK